MLVQCSNCGAPIDVNSGTLYTKCNYCGTTARRKHLTMQAPQTPPGWQPPPAWTPPPQYHAPQQPLVYHGVSRAYRASGAGVAVALFLPFLLAAGIGFFVWRQVSGAMSSFGGSSSLVWGGTDTLSCGGNSRYEVSGIEMASAAGVAIDASGNCHVEVANSTLRGDTLVKANGNAHVTIRGGTLIVGRLGIDADGIGHVELHGVHLQIGEGQSTLDGVTAVLTHSVPTSVLLDDCTVEFAGDVPGTATLVRADGGSTEFRGGKASGRFAIVTSGLGEVEAHGADLSPVAIEGGRVTGVKAAPPPPTTAPSAPASGPKAGDATLEIECTGGCDAVLVDSRKVGAAPISLTLPAGRHTVACQRAGKTRAGAVELRAGERLRHACTVP